MFDDTKKRHGGKRPGAGRKKTGRCRDSPHRKRPSLSPRHPVHVVLRTDGVPRLRTRRYYDAIRRVLTHYLGHDDFRVVHISIQANHLHFLVEANDRRALTRYMQSMTIRAAREINRAHGNRSGKVFAFRYHATQITTPRQARNTLAYVLNNWRKHREHLATERTRAAQLDQFSSGLSFTGWSGSPRFAIPEGYELLPVSSPHTGLLRFDWQLFGLIGVFERPGSG